MKISGMLARISTVFVVAGAVAVGVGGTSVADPAPRVGYYGDDIWTIGDHAFCGGTIHTAIDTDRSKPGRVFLTLTSSGFKGNGPEWTSNPVCNVDVVVDLASYVPIGGSEVTIPMHIGEAPTAPIKFEMQGVSGVNLISFHTWFAQKPVAYYILAP